MKYKNLLLTIVAISFTCLSAHSHLEEEQNKEPKAAPGEISLEKFEVNNDLDMYLGKYKSCGNSYGDVHHHPVGVLVYVAKGRTFSNISGESKEYKKGDYWFEPAGLIHGGYDPEIPKVNKYECSELVVIRLAKKGEEPTIFTE